jgi:uncharacterized tellurite resistance protein B-like protein
MLIALLAFALVVAAGVAIAYRVSPAAKVKGRIEVVLSPFEDLDAEIHRLQENLQSEIDQLARQYSEGIHTARLKALPLEELKKYAIGMRLQALKDVGVRTVYDLQGWNEFRISQVRGVGPKSAFAIVQSVATAIAAAKAVPLAYPTPPYSTDPERQLMQALYRERWFDAHVSERGNAYSTIVTSHQCARDAILSKTTFSHWLWKFGGSEVIRRSLELADTMIGALKEPSLLSMKENLTISLGECRTLCANRVPVESIVQDADENRNFYDSQLTRLLGEKSLSNPAPPPPKSGSSSQRSEAQSQERFVTVAVGSGPEQKPAEFALPSPPRPLPSTELRWLAKGEAIQIQGIILTCGFLFVGKGNSAEQHYAVNPLLPAKPDTSPSQEGAGYYFSYSTLTPEQRSRYLSWLAQGVASSSDAGFGMLYFYGIERRLLDLVRGRVSAALSGEIRELVQEVQRLSDLFKNKPGSVTQCCQRLLDFVATFSLDRASAPELPKGWYRGYELPFIMRLGIGIFMRDGRPIPLEWALRWAYLEPTIYLRTPATRCPQEFEMAFAYAYGRKYGEGMVIPANKTKLKLAYQPGWPMHLDNEIKCDFAGIPDVTALSSPPQNLKTLVEECTSLIDGYSRYLGRNPSKAGTLEALLNLPFHFWPSADKERWQTFRCGFVEPMKLVPLESLLRELGCSGEPETARVTEIVPNLSRALVGFEPDIQAGARRPKPSETIALFPLTSDSPVARTNTEYRKASLIVSLSACIALADGHATEDEAATVETMIASWQHLHLDQRTRLRAQYRLQVLQGISLSSLKSRFAGLPPEGRLQLATSLSSLATANGRIGATEVKLLEQLYRALELDPKLLYSHLHGGIQNARVPLPQMHSDSSSGLVIDTARLAALRQETDQVSSLLAGVFTEEETEIPNPSTAVLHSEFAESAPSDELLPGLDPRHRQFLTQLLSRPSWSRSELEIAAAKMQIMLDGALERINDAAFDLVGEAIVEGSDPVYVQQNILENAE